MQVWSKNNRLSNKKEKKKRRKKEKEDKRKKEKSQVFSLLNVHASLYIETSIVFKWVGVKDVCATLVLLIHILHHCSVQFALIPKTASFPCELWLLLLCPKLRKAALKKQQQKKHSSLNYSLAKFPHMYSSCLSQFPSHINLWCVCFLSLKHFVNKSSNELKSFSGMFNVQKSH